MQLIVSTAVAEPAGAPAVPVFLTPPRTSVCLILRSTPGRGWVRIQYPHPMRRALALLAIATTAPAQWQIQNSHSTASLRGIHSLGHGVAWASGTQGTILRTTDEGTTWQPCTTPPETQRLAFRSLQPFATQTPTALSTAKPNLSPPLNT